MNYALVSRPQDFLRKGIGGAVFACFVTSVIIFSFDSGEIKEIIEKVPYQNILWAGVCSFFVYTGRFLKWLFFCSILSVRVPWKENLAIFLSGLALGLTPGKLGEVLKCYILKMKYAVDFSYTAPTIIGERISGVLGCFILCLTAALYHGENNIYVLGTGLAVGIIVIIMIAILRIRSLSEWIFSKLGKVEKLKKRVNDCQIFYNSVVTILGIKVLILSVCISIVYWFCECMIFYCLLDGLGIEFSMFQAVLVLTVTSIGSGLTMLPGSVGVLEGGLIGWLVFYGVEIGVAGGVVIIHRFFAMWDVLIIGWIVLAFKWRDFGLGTQKTYSE